MILFPQDEDHDAIAEVARRSSAKSGWRAGSACAKLLMAVESVSALMLSVLVVSFGVGLL